jgi:hypothetical protein
MTKLLKNKMNMSMHRTNKAKASVKIPQRRVNDGSAIRKKCKQDIDSSCIDLPRDLGGEMLKNGRTALNQDVTHMVDSNGLLNAANADTLYKQFTEHGYLYFKGLLNRSDILESRSQILETLNGLGVFNKKNGNCEVASGWTIDTKSGTIISGSCDFSGDQASHESWRKMCKDSDIEGIRNKTKLKMVLTLLANGKSQSENCRYQSRTLAPDFSWVRVKAPNEFTCTHADIFYYKVHSKTYSIFDRR